MFIYLTGDIDSSSTFDMFVLAERELRRQGHRVNSLVNCQKTISDEGYKKERIKNVVKADKLIIINDSNSIDIQTEKTLASYLMIPMEVYNDKN